MKTLLKILGIIVLIVILGIAFLLWRFDPETLGAAVIHRLNQNEGVDITAESFALSPFKGLELQSARATLTEESRTVNLELDRLLLEHEIPLLQGRFEVHQIVLESPQIELVTAPAQPQGGRAGRSPREVEEGKAKTRLRAQARSTKSTVAVLSSISSLFASWMAGWRCERKAPINPRWRSSISMWTSTTSF